MAEKPNVLLIGASGAVSRAVLQHLQHHRQLINKLILIDKNDSLLKDKYIEHEALKYNFIKKDIKKTKQLINTIKKNKIKITIDLTDADTIPILDAVNKAKSAYINTAMNDDEKTAPQLIDYVLKNKKRLSKASHILCTGMNPGIVNMWVKYGMQKYGKPKEIIHFEYDTSMTFKWQPLITWSKHEFLIETTYQPSQAGFLMGKRKLRNLEPNALMNREDMTTILKPIMKLKKYPSGFPIIHEENITIANKFNVPSKFLYAINIKTMQLMEKTYKSKHTIKFKDLVIADNEKAILKGADNIGVLLKYPNKLVYYLNTMSNKSTMGTSATCKQVAIGVCSALITMLTNKIKPGIYFVHDLHKTVYKKIMFDNMRVQEYIFTKRKGKLLLKKYTPQIKTTGQHLLL